MAKPLLAFIGLCICIQSFGQRQEADSLLKELTKHPEEDTVRFLMLKRLSYLYRTIDAAKGIEAADAAITLAKKLNSDTRLAGAYANKATNLHMLGRDSEAIVLYTVAVNLNLNAGNKKGAANVYFNIGYAYFETGNFIRAIDNELKAIELYKELGFTEDESDTYTNIANAYLRLSNYPSALQYHLKALAINQKLNQPDKESLTLANIGMIYHELSDPAKAMMYYKQALKIDEQRENKSNLAHDYQHIGVLFEDAKQFDTALFYYQKALQLNKEINERREMASNLANIASIYSQLKNYPLALKNINDALEIYKILTDKFNTANLLNEKGKIYAYCPPLFLQQQHIPVLQRYNTALLWQQQGLILAKETGSFKLTAYILNDISETYENSGDFSNALHIHRQADAMRDSIYNDSLKQRITRLEMQYDFDKKEAATRALNDKKQALARAEILKQKLIRNITIISGTGLVFTAIISFMFYKKRKDAIEAKKESDLKTEVTITEMKALRAQMNPHFIFNSLNSIADYIDKHETQTASEFTAKFAKLMRLVLENSEHKEIPLADDLKALELYMQLERFRLNNKFNYKINIDENIDKENVLVPPLILQPFVENSIWHGIAKKEGVGNITIHIRQMDSMINCIVEDDGVGIAENKLNKQGYKSLGMRITNERVAIINKIKNTNASVNIFNSNNGVRAEVSLPLELSF